MKKAIKFLEKMKRSEEISAQECEASGKLECSVMHWTNAVHLGYAISILNEGISKRNDSGAG